MVLDQDVVTLDIETVPRRDLPPELYPVFDESEVKLGNLKDPFKIAEKMKQAKEAFDSNVTKMMSVDPDLCEICCIVAKHKSSGEYFKKGNWGDDPSMDDELEMIHSCWQWVGDHLAEGCRMVSFNGLGFDLPVMLRRSMLLDIFVHPDLISKLTRPQQQNQHHYDLMQLLGRRSPFSGKMEFRPLNYYLKLFNLGGKTEGMDGSSVYPAWKEGRFQEIIDYCRQDVDMTEALWERVSPWLPAINGKRSINQDSTTKE